jgi:hypothetical protein
MKTSELAIAAVGCKLLKTGESFKEECLTPFSLTHIFLVAKKMPVDLMEQVYLYLKILASGDNKKRIYIPVSDEFIKANPHYAQAKIDYTKIKPVPLTEAKIYLCFDIETLIRDLKFFFKRSYQSNHSRR